MAAVGAIGAGTVQLLTPANVPASERVGLIGIVFLLVLAVAAATGLLLALRRPRNAIGWLLLLTAIALAMSASNGYATNAMYAPPGTYPIPSVVDLLGSSGWFIAFGSMFLLIPLLFPDGRALSPRWRWALWPAVAAIVLFEIGQDLDPQGLDVQGRHHVNPIGITGAHDLLGAVSGIAAIFFALTLVLAIISLVLRYRGGDLERRHQLKWFIAATGLVVVYAAVSNLIPASVLPVWVTNLGTGLAFMALPVAIAIAVLKYRLYDIDVVISRTLVYGALAAFITAVYVGIVVGVGTLVGAGGKPNLLLSIVATAIVAVGFQPVRERLQKIANRLVYGKRATPYEVLSQFSERVAETYAADEALPKMARVLAEGTGAERAEVWLRNGTELRAAAIWPVDANGRPAFSIADDALPQISGADRAVAVRHQGELLGALTVAKRQGESLTPVEEKLLDDLASQAGLVLKNVGLTTELLARLEELRASRQRLVAAQDEERRRLERNLHDGAQQNLVALKVKLGLAEALAENDPAKAKELVTQLKADADEALETLRDLARGIYPPLLADKGLAVALESQARKATLPVDVSADGIGRFPQDIEAAVYFCVLEALQNVQKYARATRATVRLSALNGDLSFEVEDDGAGFDAARAKTGSGLTNMADRLDALGGAVAVDSEPGRGTRLRGRIPVLEGVP
ncbi:MAG: sensor histidine kinase [Candidatus Dormiibacterota bacterium]